MAGPDPRLQARELVQRNPGHPGAWIMLAEAELDAGDTRAGEAACLRALALAPGHPEALARLGRAQWMAGRHDEAAKSLRGAAAAAPRHPGIALWLGHALEDAGEPEGAADAYARAHALAPGEPQIAAHLLAWRRRLCDWQGLDALSGQVRAAVRSGHAAVEPFAFLAEEATAAEQLQCARRWAASLAATVRPLPRRTRATATPLRLGFLSNGFGAHPTGLLVVALMEAIKAAGEAEAHLFALNPDDGSRVRQRLAAASRLHALEGRDDGQVADAIRQAGIDVLFDLRGWGGGGRPRVLALRPAPVQVNWLAYPGTSGAPWIDYVLADAFVLPASMTAHFSEQVVRLPRCFQPSDTTRALPPPPSRESCGLPPSGVVFCCFNNSYKLTPRSMHRAFRVLEGVPGSVLWLLSGPGRADQRLREQAGARGIDPARLVFMDKQPHTQYLARLQLADLFLDTHPYNAHTTASDALWAGCPVLTCPGDTFAARVAGSLNHHLGLPGMNARDDAEFIGRAVALGNDQAALAALRDTVAAARRDGGLFDTERFAADFVAAAAWMAGVRPVASQHLET